MTDLDHIAQEIIKTIQNSIVPVRYMSLKQASVYSGYGQKALIKLAKEGKIKGRQRTDIDRGDWSFDKESIDAYWHEPFNRRTAIAKSIIDLKRRKA